MTVLRPLFERRTYRELLFLTSGAALAGVWLGLFLAGYIAAGVLAVTPLLIPILIGFRALVWAGATLEAGLARELLGVDVRVAPLRTGDPGYVGRIRGILGDAAFWREQTYLLARMLFGFAAGVGAVSAAGWSLALAVMPLWYAPAHPDVGSWYVDTLGRAFACVPLGLLGLLLSAWLVRGLAAISRPLAAGLLDGGGAPPEAPPPALGAFRTGLPYHAALFSLVNLIAIVSWAATTRAYFWPEWTLMPLGMLLVGHAWVVLVLDRVRAHRGLLVHLGLSSALWLFLVGIWAVTTRAYFWPLWPALGLGVVLALHAIATRPWSDRAELVERIGVLTETRAGAVDVAEDELRRIERDLHDGAQARLVALGMSLGLAEQRLADDPEGARRLLGEARAGAEEALRELRDLARGIHPPVLADRGLAAALAALVARSPLPVELDVDLSERPPAAVETAAYFVAAETLANAAKHADATRVAVRISRDGDGLAVRVEDDGCGGADPAGRGLSGVRRRVEALDGRLSVTSPSGGPTIVEAVMPCGR